MEEFKGLIKKIIDGNSEESSIKFISNISNTQIEEFLIDMVAASQFLRREYIPEEWYLILKQIAEWQSNQGLTLR